MGFGRTTSGEIIGISGENRLGLCFSSSLSESTNCKPERKT